MWGKLRDYWLARKKRKFRRLSAPEMIYAFEHKGEVLKDTRMGSSTTVVGGENLELADNVFIGQYNFIEASNGMKIGEGCQITNYISILTHSSHNSIRYYGKYYRRHTDLTGYVKGGVEIGMYTFVGPHVTIMPSTKIGKGCIVSAYSFVSGEFPDFSIIAGNPAVVVGSVKERDAEFLKDHPELQEFYNEWISR
jgi:acetyltransferase-like isoleucine patch superfamily enzyme